MNTDIWLNIAKYKAKVKNTDWDQYRAWYTEYPITENEYAKLKLAIANKEPFTWIHDLDWNRLREVNAKRDIKEFSPIVHSNYTSWISITCEFWVTHNIVWWDRDCKCSDIYKCSWVVFKDKLEELLWIKIQYNSDITDEMRSEYIKLTTHDT